MTDKVINLHNIDNMVALKQMKDNQFDLAIVDTPYGIGEDGGKNRKGYSKAWENQKQKNYTKKNWDNKPESKEYFTELKRISNNQIIWGANHFIENIPNANSSGWVCWYKAGQNPNSDFSKCELAYTSFKNANRGKLPPLPWENLPGDADVSRTRDNNLGIQNYSSGGVNTPIETRNSIVNNAVSKGLDKLQMIANSINSAVNPTASPEEAASIGAQIGTVAGTMEAPSLYSKKINEQFGF